MTLFQGRLAILKIHENDPGQGLIPEPWNMDFSRTDPIL